MFFLKGLTAHLVRNKQEVAVFFLKGLTSHLVRNEQEVAAVLFPKGLTSHLVLNEQEVCVFFLKGFTLKPESHLVLPHQEEDVLKAHEASPSHDGHVRCLTQLKTQHKR